MRIKIYPRENENKNLHNEFKIKEKIKYYKTKMRMEPK